MYKKMWSKMWSNSIDVVKNRLFPHERAFHLVSANKKPAEAGEGDVVKSLSALRLGLYV